MINVQSILLNELPIQIDKFVGVLLFHEYPVTTIYSGKNGLPVVKEWVDCNDEVDRFLIFQSSKENLKRFIEGVISHEEFITSPINEIIFLSEEKDGAQFKISLITPPLIPLDYLPDSDSYFLHKNGVQTESIISYFDLRNVDLEPSNLEEHLKNLAIKKRTEVFNIHLSKGQSIRHGRIDTDVLGGALLSFDNLYKEIALDHFFGRNRGELKIPPSEKKEKLGLSTTEVFLNKAASFVVYIKPKHYSQVELFDNKTTSKIITENLFNLFGISKEIKILKENYLNYSDYVYKSYRDFLNYILEQNIELDLNWADRQSTLYISEDFNITKANNIINSINNINSETTDTFESIGKFRAINCNTGHFTFESLEKEQFSGYFEKLIKDSAPTLTFTKLYEITIERTIIKEAGLPEAKIQDVIISFLEIDDKG